MEQRWGWQEDRRLDGIKRKYVKWILGLNWRTPNYILAEETKIRGIKNYKKAIKRAIKYEEKIRSKEEADTGMHKGLRKEAAIKGRRQLGEDKEENIGKSREQVGKKEPRQEYI